MKVYVLCDHFNAECVTISARLFESDQVAGYALRQEVDDATEAAVREELERYRLIVSTHDEEAPFVGLSSDSCLLREDTKDAEVAITDEMVAIQDGRVVGLILPGHFYYAKTEYGDTVTKQHERLIFLPLDGSEILVSLHSTLTIYSHDGEESESKRRLYYRVERH